MTMTMVFINISNKCVHVLFSHRLCSEATTTTKEVAPIPRDNSDYHADDDDDFDNDNDNDDDNDDTDDDDDVETCHGSQRCICDQSSPPLLPLGPAIRDI